MLGLLGLLLIGCANPAYQERAWQDGPSGGRILQTAHYDLHTTLPDRQLNDDLAKTMERSYALYRQLTPVPVGELAEGADDRLAGFVFHLRREWEEHTRETTGPQAELYLQIGRGGYAHGDSFATFYYGGPQMLSVCRHEGWHQYVATQFKQRPPAFLEEGLATLFEWGFDQNDISKPRGSMTRMIKLREAVRRQRAWSLARLLTMNAGHVVGTDAPQIDTFYAQAWGFARFLVEDDEYRLGLRKLLAAYAAGEVRLPPPLAMQQYFGVPFEKISSDYEAYVRRLTYVPGS